MTVDRAATPREITALGQRSRPRARPIDSFGVHLKGHAVFWGATEPGALRGGIA